MILNTLRPSARPFPISVLLGLGACLLLWAGSSCGGTGPFETVQGEERIDVMREGKLFTSYRYPSDWKFPYLYPLPGPLTGESLTIELGRGHPHHRSMYFALDKVNGGNYWQEGMDRGRMVSRGPRVLEAGERVVIADSCDWERDGAPSPVQDFRMVTIEVRSATIQTLEYQIDLLFKIDTHIEKSNHALFCIEVPPELSVKWGSGKILNSLGGRNEKGTFGVKAPWCDYTGERDDLVEGIAIFQHPGNPCFPWQFFTRNYGFMSPTPMFWIDDEGLDYRAGEKVSLTFLTVLHAGNPREAGLETLFQEWSQTVPKPVPTDFGP